MIHVGATGNQRLETAPECTRPGDLGVRLPLFRPLGDDVEIPLLLAQSEGIFAETAGGVTVSALKQLARAGHVKPDEVVVAYVTGGGLKTQEAVQDSLPEPIHIAANIDAFEEAWAARKAAVATS